VTGTEIPRDALLFSMDVESFYPNIDNNSGIEAVKQGFLRNPDFDRPDVDILELLKKSHWNTTIFYSHPIGTFIFLHCNGETICPQLCQPFHGRMGQKH